jgi:hypothetical protein
MNHRWASSTVGTPPFQCGLWIATATGTDVAGLGDFLDAYVAGAWTEIHNVMSSELGAGSVHIEGSLDGAEVDVSRALPATGGTPPTPGPGWCYRVVFIAPRPRGKRPNQCYFPVPSQGGVGSEGGVDSSIQGAFTDWGSELISEATDANLQWVARHGVAPDGSGGTENAVTGADCRGTASWLQRHYR